jgi:Ser/Thr protein kinase RdoA (MazF antagonist)
VSNSRVGDLANFIRKMMEKNNWNAGLGMDLIRGYDRVRKLSPEELKYLYVYLAYPEKFWKIANRYYNSHKAWLSGRNIEKLEKVVAQEDAREQFLQMLFHFTV